MPYRLEAGMVVSLNSGTQTKTPKYHSPYYRGPPPPKKKAPILANPQMRFWNGVQWKDAMNRG